jgi:predicted nucleotide-binding protein (sugar kinase/HSP70/actin superfamily)
MARTTYFPYMCDHAHPAAAAFRAFGIPAAVLPRPDQESLATALELCRGRECLPCFITTGDFVKKCREPGFDAQQTTFFMPTGHGPCRFGQYRWLQRDILERLGFAGVEVVSPTSDEAYQLAGEGGGALRALVWRAIVATDLLLKLLHEYRPYELEAGRAEQAYQRSLARLVTAVEAKGGDALTRAMEFAAREFAAVPVDRSTQRPLIGMVGELFVAQNTFTNNDIIREVEALGGEVLLGTFVDWLYYCDYRRKELAWHFGDYAEFFKALLQEVVEHGMERDLEAPVKHLLRNPGETRVGPAVKLIAHHYDPMLGGEGVLTMVRALDYARHRLSGILNILPFSCMLGTIVSGMAPRLRRDLMHMIPWLDVPFDGQAVTNIRTRLGAFMHQAAEYRRAMDGRPEGGTAGVPAWEEEGCGALGAAKPGPAPA